MAKKQSTKQIEPEIVLSDVRHTGLGMAIESLQDELLDLEALYKQLLETDSKAAYIVRQVLNATDWLESEYGSVAGYAGYTGTTQDYNKPLWQQRNTL